MKRILCVISMLLILCSCAGNQVDDFWNDGATPNMSYETGQASSDYLPEETESLTQEELLEYRQNLAGLYGENWHSDNYSKSEIKIPVVEAEETVKGELWFPPINNTAPLDEIVPTIPYELAMNGYNISSYYPENPEDYTAQALNNNAFPIAFFRKINNLYYYTVCKVEGGGYMYYFFMANSGADYIEACNDNGVKVNYKEDGTPSIDYTYHLYNAKLAKNKNIDLTRECIWRASVYSTEDLGTLDEFCAKLNATKNTVFSGEAIYDVAKRADSSIFMLEELLPKMAENMLGEPPKSITDEFNAIQDFKTISSLVISKHLCRDGFWTVSYGMWPFDTISNRRVPRQIKDSYNIWYKSSGGTPRLKGTNDWFTLSPLADNENISEDNTVVIKILPQDYMW